MKGQASGLVGPFHKAINHRERHLVSCTEALTSHTLICTHREGGEKRARERKRESTSYNIKMSFSSDP